MVTPEVLVFDSDGVIASGGILLPHAIDLFDKLEKDHFPFYVLTNNPFLDPKAKSLSYKKLGLNISENQIVGAAHPLNHSLSKIKKTHSKVFAIGIENPESLLQKHGFQIDNQSNNIDAILLLDDDEKWDANLVSYLLNLLIHNPQLPLIVPNPDLVFPDKPNNLFLTSGSWAHLLVHLCSQKGLDISPIYLGKPYTPIYECLIEQMKADSLFPKKESIFMLGDSPATDISGANQQGWTSILIQTGNHHYGLDKPNCQADFTFANLESFDKNFFN